MADRQGRLKDEPAKIEAELFPFKFQRVKIDELLAGLAAGEDPFILRYEAKGQKCITIINFLTHQTPHHQEVESHLPPCRKNFAPRSEALRTNNGTNPSSSLTPDSGLLTPSSLTPDSKTPSALERRSAAAPFWREVIQHLNDTWTAKKRGAKYLWQGKDFASLKRALKVYQAWDLMSLWDAFINSQDEFAIKQGYSVPEFVRQIPRLVDDPAWKTRSKKYEDKLIPLSANGMDKINDLVAGLGKEMPK